MNKYITIIFTLILFASCEDVIDVKLNDQDQSFYAIEAKITTIDEPWVTITKTIPVTTDEPYQGISNSIVTISDDLQPANTVTLVESELKGVYIVPEGTDYLGVPGRTYTITIENTDGVIITASETLYPVEPIDSILVYPSLRGEKRFLGIFTFGNETPGLGNYYKWDIFINDTLLSDADLLSFASDELVDGNYISGLEIFTDFHDPDDESERKIKFMDTILVEQTSISAFAYEFYFQMINQASAGFLFSVPPANLPSNFTASNGSDVYGIFNANDVSVSNTIVIDENIEKLLNKN